MRTKGESRRTVTDLERRRKEQKEWVVRVAASQHASSFWLTHEGALEMSPERYRHLQEIEAQQKKDAAPHRRGRL